MGRRYVACEVITSLSLEYGVMSEQILAVMHDCASTNTVAMRTLKVLYPLVLDVGCFSHTLDCVGERFNVPTLHCFMIYWIRLYLANAGWDINLIYPSPPYLCPLIGAFTKG